jgi:hypothetical protein
LSCGWDFSPSRTAAAVRLPAELLPRDGRRLQWRDRRHGTDHQPGPRETASLRVIFGTASTREDLGYVLPPGRYWLSVQMHLHHGPGTPQTTTPAAPLKQITVIPQDQELRNDQPGRHEE